MSIPPVAFGAAANLIPSAGRQVTSAAASFGALLESALDPDQEGAAASRADDITGPAPRLLAQQDLASQVAAESFHSTSFADLRYRAETAIEAFHQRLTRELSDLGIDLENGVRLQVRPGDGRIVVLGDSANKAAIESLFATNTELAGAVRSISSLVDLLRAANENAEFAAAYEEDPVVAIDRFAHLFDETTARRLELFVDSYDIRAEFI